MTLKQSTKKPSFVESMFDGAFSSFMSRMITAPIERVKMLLQTQDILESTKKTSKFNGIINCFRRLLKEEGFLSLWRGNLINIIRHSPTQSLNFAINEFLKNHFLMYQREANYRMYFISCFCFGGISGASSMVMTYPLEFLRTVVSTDLGNRPSDRRFTGPTDCASKIIKMHGFSGLFQGINVSLFAVFFYRGIYFGGTEFGRSEMHFVKQYRLIKFIYYQMVTVTAGFIVHPLDTVRRRLMVQGSYENRHKNYKGAIDCFRVMWKNEGIKGFYKGGLSNAFRGIGAALMMMFFDELSKLRKSE